MASGDPTDRTDLYGGLALVAALIGALVIANSPFEPHYRALLDAPAEVRIGALGLKKDLEHWINDGLMAIFFLLIGLEVKRELVEGALAGVRQAALPTLAALAGFVLPAAIYAWFNASDPQALRGWAVPSATDIAFALGICAFLGRSVPASLRAFLLAVAIIDDLMAIIVIAVFYTDQLSTTALILAGLGVVVLAALNLSGVRRPAPYVVTGVVIWVCVLKSGIHATLAGAILGLTIPIARQAGKSLLLDMEHALKPWVSFAVVPIFAFANAGISLAGVSLASLAAPIPLGIIAGLLVGKSVGVFGAAVAATGLGLAPRLPAASTAQLFGVAILTGIGFTMSLFIGTLAFDDPRAMAEVRIGVLVASALCAALAVAVLLAARPRATLGRP
jgi:NhaA family Na+:H+ antiporter